MGVVKRTVGAGGGGGGGSPDVVLVEALLTSSTTFSVAAGTRSTLVFDNEVIDVAGLYDETTGIFSSAANRLVKLNATARLNGSGTLGNDRLIIDVFNVTDSVPVAPMAGEISGFTGTGFPTLSTTARPFLMEAGKDYRIDITNLSGGSTNVFGNAAGATSLFLWGV